MFGIVGCSTPVVTDSELACFLPCGTTSRAFLPLPIKPLREESLPSQAYWVNVALLSTRLLQW